MKAGISSKVGSEESSEVGRDCERKEGKEEVKKVLRDQEGKEVNREAGREGALNRDKGHKEDESYSHPDPSHRIYPPASHQR